MNETYLVSEAVATSSLSTALGSCPSIQRRIQLYLPYLMTLRYGGEVKISRAGALRALGVRASPSHASPRIALALGIFSLSTLAATISKTSTSGACKSCSEI